MNRKEILEKAVASQEEARLVLNVSGIGEVWKSSGCRVNLIGSLRMGLLATHRDIDRHVYSEGVDEVSSFAIASQIAKIPGVIEIKCINGLHTDEHCITWHIFDKKNVKELKKYITVLWSLGWLLVVHLFPDYYPYMLC